MSAVKTNLNQLISSFGSPAAIAAGHFVAWALSNQGSQRVLVSEISYNVLYQNIADFANGIPVLFLQRNLAIDPGSLVFTGGNANETITKWDLDFRVAGRNSTFGVFSFPRPIPLEPGVPYAAVLNLTSFAPFAGGATLELTVIGDQVSTDGAREFPYTLR